MESLLKRVLEGEIGELRAELAAYARVHIPRPEPHRPYARAVLGAVDGVHFLLVRWQRGVFCAPHDHGNATVTTWLLEGRLTERRWRIGAKGLILEAAETYTAPALFNADLGAIHDMASATGALSLHAYSTANDAMRLFDVRRRSTILVGPAAGAWLPAAPEHIVERVPWKESRA